MEKLISGLDDATAVTVLRQVAGPRLDDAELVLDRSPDVCRALSDGFGAAAVADGVSEGDLARTALQFLAADSDYRSALQSLTQSPEPERLGFVETVSVGTAALLVLQTHVKFERRHNGIWSLKIEKRPTDESLLKSLAESLLRFWNASSGDD